MCTTLVPQNGDCTTDVPQGYVIKVRLRAGRDDDLAAWYESQSDKSAAVRDAIRAVIRMGEHNAVTAAVREAVTRELARLPDIVAAAVHDALSAYQLTALPPAREPGAEDPELAARLDAQLAEFFGE